MKLRPIQLVCFALLLSALSLADCSAMLPAQYQLQSVLLLDEYSRVWTGLTRHQRPERPEHQTVATATRKNAPRSLAKDLSSASLAAVQTAWSMRPPSAQYAALQSHTGFGRASA